MFKLAFVFYLFIVNVITFFMFGADKRKAQRHEWRTPEATLLAMAAIGGSVGALLGIRIFHHKTRHLKFTVGVPFLLVVNICVIAVVIRLGMKFK